MKESNVLYGVMNERILFLEETEQMKWRRLENLSTCRSRDIRESCRLKSSKNLKEMINDGNKN